jgi:hypothetical protein
MPCAGILAALARPRGAGNAIPWRSTLFIARKNLRAAGSGSNGGKVIGGGSRRTVDRLARMADGDHVPNDSSMARRFILLSGTRVSIISGASHPEPQRASLATLAMPMAP